MCSERAIFHSDNGLDHRGHTSEGFSVREQEAARDAFLRGEPMGGFLILRARGLLAFLRGAVAFSDSVYVHAQGDQRKTVGSENLL